MPTFWFSEGDAVDGPQRPLLPIFYAVPTCDPGSRFNDPALRPPPAKRGELFGGGGGGGGGRTGLDTDDGRLKA